MTKAIVFVLSLSFFLSAVVASTQEEENKAIAKRAFEEILSNGNFALTPLLYAKDFVNHGLDRDASLQEDQAAIRDWRQAFSDIVVEPKKLIAEGEMVTVYWIARGTNTGTSAGFPATGKKVEIAGITIWRIAGGKIKEEWSSFDQFSMMQQLGLIPSESK